MEQNFKDWVATLTGKYKRAQIKASIRVNSELIAYYFELGREINRTSFKKKYGTKFFENLSRELRKELSDAKGFSIENLRYVEKFYILYKNISQQLVGKLYFVPWGHHRYIIDKCKDIDKALFYVNKIIENNWSRSLLLTAIGSGLYERTEKAITNFTETFSDHGIIASQLIKDPYNFNFLSIDEKYSEKELKDALLVNIEKFLTELGTGFAYMGREFRLKVGRTELFLDMLFYNTRAHAYVVVEVKIGKFKPEYIGQLGTYVVSVDHILKTDRGEKTIGILICKDKDSVLARYSIESSAQPLGISSFELMNIIPDNFKSNFPTIEEIEYELMNTANADKNDDMHYEYDFSNAKKSPYTNKLKKQGASTTIISDGKKQ